MNGGSADGLSGWTLWCDAGSLPNGLLAIPCPPLPPSSVPCLEDNAGLDELGSNVHVSSVHTVLPGKALSAAIRAQISISAVGSPDTMHYLSDPPLRSQVRNDV